MEYDSRCAAVGGTLSPLSAAGVLLLVACVNVASSPLALAHVHVAAITT